MTLVFRVDELAGGLVIEKRCRYVDEQRGRTEVRLDPPRPFRHSPKDMMGVQSAVAKTGTATCKDPWTCKGPWKCFASARPEDMIDGVLFGSGSHLWPFPTESLHE
jgi:hypothetical protein